MKSDDHSTGRRQMLRDLSAGGISETDALADTDTKTLPVASRIDKQGAKIAQQKKRRR
jgi:hypothetical protein